MATAMGTAVRSLLVFSGFDLLVLALHSLYFWVDVILPKFVERLFQDIRARAEKCRTSRCRNDVAFATGPHAMLVMPPQEFLREQKADKRLLQVPATGRNLLLCNCPLTRVCCCMQILYHWWLWQIVETTFDFVFATSFLLGTSVSKRQRGQSGSLGDGHDMSLSKNLPTADAHLFLTQCQLKKPTSAAPYAIANHHTPRGFI